MGAVWLLQWLVSLSMCWRSCKQSKTEQLSFCMLFLFMLRDVGGLIYLSVSS